MIDVAALFIAYLVSQFYRSFLAVLAPALREELGVDPATLSDAAGAWFLAFAVAQIPVGMGLDRIGPRRVAGWLMIGGAGGGGALFAMAESAEMLIASMALIGVGCAPVLMSGMVIFARRYPPARFATLSGAMIGFGSLGNVLGAAPLAWGVEAFGWREVMLALAGLGVAIGGLVLTMVKDPPLAAEAGDSPLRGFVAVMKLRILWWLIPLGIFNYAVSAGLRGSWAGPYFEDVHGLDAEGIGAVTLWMALAMVAGNFVVGPLAHRLGTTKWVVFTLNLAAAGCTGALALGGTGEAAAAWLFGLIGLCGATYALLMAQARSFVPLHLTGRGVTLMNFFSIGGVGLGQIVTARIHSFADATWSSGALAYQAVFGYYALALLGALAIYLFSRDARTEG
ncbi:MFS transporter [Rhodovulum sp. DZ06]|uniref:MFS transporter n=1 Tax=Rhodovulum sp. DZ06 TaxID=3425126 RepID=UPI003D32D391